MPSVPFFPPAFPVIVEQAHWSLRAKVLSATQPQSLPTQSTSLKQPTGSTSILCHGLLPICHGEACQVAAGQEHGSRPAGARVGYHTTSHYTSRILVGH